jgi:TonB family protein
MWRITLFLALCSYTAAQAALPLVDPDEAANHLIKRITPKYPSLAEMARIQGNVVLDAVINESGIPGPILVVSGHPMLLDSALNAVKQCRYQPFEINGKPAAVRTFILVQFGNPYPRHDLEDRAEVLTLMAKSLLGGSDLSTAKDYLKKASDLLASAHDDQSQEREQWLATMGQLDLAEKKYDEAERDLKQALELAQHRDPNASVVAERLGWLAQLYALENKYDLVRTYGEQEIEACEKSLKKSKSDPVTQQRLSSEIAYRAWMLAEVALQQKEQAEASKNCRFVLDYQAYLGTSYRDQAISACKKELNQGPK